MIRSCLQKMKGVVVCVFGVVLAKVKNPSKHVTVLVYWWCTSHYVSSLLRQRCKSCSIFSIWVHYHHCTKKSLWLIGGFSPGHCIGTVIPSEKNSVLALDFKHIWLHASSPAKRDEYYIVYEDNRCVDSNFSQWPLINNTPLLKMYKSNEGWLVANQTMNINKMRKLYAQYRSGVL